MMFLTICNNLTQDWQNPWNKTIKYTIITNIRNWKLQMQQGWYDMGIYKVFWYTRENIFTIVVTRIADVLDININCLSMKLTVPLKYDTCKPSNETGLIFFKLEILGRIVDLCFPYRGLEGCPTHLVLPSLPSALKTGPFALKLLKPKVLFLLLCSAWLKCCINQIQNLVFFYN